MKELDLLFVNNVSIQHMFVFTFSLYCYLFLLNGQGLMRFMVFGLSSKLIELFQVQLSRMIQFG